MGQNINNTLFYFFKFEFKVRWCDIQLPLYICSFQQFKTETTTKKGNIWEKFQRKSFKAETPDTSASKQVLETNSTDTKKPHGQALLRLSTTAWTSHCAFKIPLVPQPIIWSTSGRSGCCKKYASSKTDHNFHFIHCDVSGCDCSVSTNALLRISVLLSRKTHWCHWIM